MQKNCDPCREKAAAALEEKSTSPGRGRPRKDPVTGGDVDPGLRVAACIRGGAATGETKRHLAILAKTVKSALDDEDAPAAQTPPPRADHGAKPVATVAVTQYLNSLPQGARDAVKRGMGEWTAAKRGAFCVVQITPTQFGVHVPGNGCGFASEHVLVSAGLLRDGRWRIKKGGPNE